MIKIYFFFLCLASLLAGAKDFYDILGVSKNDSPDKIKAAYRKLAIKYHPDTNPGNEDALAKMKEINEAFEVLSNKSQRAEYDSFGTTGNSRRRQSYENSQGYAPSEEEIRRAMRAKAEQMAHRSGKANSNSVWTYDPATFSFTDKRTGKKSIWNFDPNQLGFYTPEGWSFEPQRGNYYDWATQGSWNPSEGGWYRFEGGKKINIDIKTGFPTSFSYRPTTRSESANYFEDLLNPTKHKRHEKLRAEFKNHIQTSNEKNDFVARAKEHLRVVDNSDAASYGPNMAFIAAIFSTPGVEEFPELAEYVFSLKKKYFPGFIHEFGTKMEYLNSPRFLDLLDQAMKSDKNNVTYFIDGINGREGRFSSNPRFLVEEFKKALPILLKNMGAPEIKHLILNTYRMTPEDAKNLESELLSIMQHPKFKEAVADSIPHENGFIKFLERLPNSKEKELYLEALKMEMPKWEASTPQSQIDRMREDTVKKRKVFIRTGLEELKRTAANTKAQVAAVEQKPSIELSDLDLSKAVHTGKVSKSPSGTVSYEMKCGDIFFQITLDIRNK